MAKALTLSEAIALARKQARKALADAAQEIETKVVTDAQKHAPVRKLFKEKRRQKYRRAKADEMRRLRAHSFGSFGKSPYASYRASKNSMTGRQSKELVNKNFRGTIARSGPGGVPAGDRNRLWRQAFSEKAPGSQGTGYFEIGEFTRKKTKFGEGPRTFKGLGTQVFNSSTSKRNRFRKVSGVGYELSSPELQGMLTSRARYNLAHAYRSDSGVRVVKTPGRKSHEVLVYGGALRDSIHADTTIGQNTAIIRIKADVPYAKYVEFGTYKDHAQPFMYPALKNMASKQDAIIAKHLRKAGFKVKG